MPEQPDEAQAGDPTVRMAPPAPPPPPPQQPPPQPPQQPLPAPVSPWPDLPPVGPPRIVPTPKPQRTRLVPGILIGVLVGLLVFAPAGYLFRAVTAHPKAAASPGPTASPVETAGAMSAFERNQLTLNQAKVTGDLATFAKSWLPYVSGCNGNADQGGPKLGDGETTRVQCRYGAVNIYFVQFGSTGARDAALGRRKAMNADAKQLNPGVADLKQRKTPSGNAEGNYVEYGFKGDNGHTYAGLWWDNTDTPVGGFLVADWHEGLNDSWEPMRDLWQRYS
jgi:hypothetical protein